MRGAIAAGASIINDVQAYRRPAPSRFARRNVGVVLMHMQGQPGTMRAARHDGAGGVVGEVSRYLSERAQACEAAGIARDRIVLDPASASAKPPNTTSNSPAASAKSSPSATRSSPAGRENARSGDSPVAPSPASACTPASPPRSPASHTVRGLCGCMMWATVDALRVWGRWWRAIDVNAALTTTIFLQRSVKIRLYIQRQG